MIDPAERVLLTERNSLRVLDPLENPPPPPASSCGRRRKRSFPEEFPRLEYGIPKNLEEHKDDGKRGFLIS